MFSASTVSKLVDAGRVALDNAATPEIAARMASYGYDAARLQEGRALWETLRSSLDEHMRLYGEQKTATANFKAAWQAAQKHYMRWSKIARAQLAERPDWIDRLGLKGERAKAFPTWQTQARAFYTGLSAGEIAAQLAPVGWTAATAQEGLALLDAAAQADTAQESLKGAAQQSTQARDAAAAAFQDWLRKFWKVAEAALADTPQWLESLGKKIR